MDNHSQTTRKIAVAYYRYSSKNQREASIEIQRKYVTKYAKENNIPIVHEYIDEAYSGTNANRPQFQTMIYDANKQSFNTILVYASSRFSRNAFDVLTYQNKLNNLGIEIISVTEQFADTPEGNLMSLIQTAINDYYSKELRQKIIRGNQQNYSEGRANGRPHVGYKINKNDKYEIDPLTGPIVAEMFKKYAYNNYSIDDCINFLNEMGVPNRYGMPYKRNGVTLMLKNPFYNGQYYAGGIYYGNIIPALVDDDTFNLVQARLQSNRKMPSRHTNDPSLYYCLSSKLFCTCGHSMHGVSAYGKRKTLYRYYVCSHGKGKAKECNCKPIPKDLLENAVKNNIVELFSDTFIRYVAHRVYLLSKSDPHAKQLTLLTKELKATNKAIKHLLQGLEAGGPADIIAAQLSKRKEEKEKLEEQIKQARLSSNIISEESIISFLQRFKYPSTITDDAFQLMINILIKKITVFYDGKELKMTITYNVDDSQMNGGPYSFDEGSSNSSIGGAGGSRTRVQESSHIQTSTV